MGVEIVVGTIVAKVAIDIGVVIHVVVDNFVVFDIVFVVYADVNIVVYGGSR